MTTIQKIIFAMVAVLAALWSVARADIASGSYTVEFDGNVSLWDISGTYSEDIDGLTVDYTLSVDPSGKITGYGSANYAGNYGIGIDTTFNLSGTVTTAGSVTRVTLNMTMKGSGQFQGSTINFGASLKESMEIDADASTLVGTTSGNVSLSVSGLGSFGEKIPATDVTLDLPSDMDGTWDLTLNATTGGAKVTGTGQIVLSNGSVYGFTLTGTYAFRTGLSKVTMKGLPADKTITANLVADFSKAGMNVKSLKGKALGQTLTYTGGT